MTQAVFEGVAPAISAAISALFAAGELWQAIALGKRGLHALALAPRPTPATLDAALVFGRFSAVANFQGDGAFARTIGVAAKAAEEARRLGDRGREAAALDLAGLAHYYADMMMLTETYTEATSYFERATALIGAEGPELAAVLFHRGLVEERLGRFEAADTLFRRAAALAESDPLVLSYAVRHIAFADQRRGDLASALAGVERSLALRRGLGLRPYLPLTLLAVADVRLALGEREQASALVEEALAEADNMHLPCGQVFALLGRLGLAKGDGDIGRAARDAEAAAAIARRVGYPRWINMIERIRGTLA